MGNLRNRTFGGIFGKNPTIDSIEKILPNNVKILESGEAVAKQTKKIIIDKNLVGNNKNPTYNFYCNGGDNSLKKILINNFKINTI